MKAGVHSPRLEAEILLAHAIRARRQDIYLEPNRALNARELGEHQDLIQRRILREPISYILGRREFWSLEFNVSPAALVPRPETEVLIERFLEMFRRRTPAGETRVLDIGTGSGNIAIVVAREIPECRVTATDISPAALAVAERNARAHRAADRIRFVQSDLFENVDGDFQYDFILSNPPYIPSDDLRRLMPDVRNYEPWLALDGGTDGLEFYKRIIPGASRRLKEGGSLLVEIGMDQALDVVLLLEQDGHYEEPEVFRDYGGRDRVVSAKRKRNG